MADNNENSFIQETIVIKRKKRWLKRLGTVGFIVLCALIFGVVARIAFALSGDKVNDLLGIDNQHRTDVVISTNRTPTPIATSTPVVKPTATPTEIVKAPTLSPTPENSPTTAPTPTPEETPGVEGNTGDIENPEVEPQPTDEPSGSEDEQNESHTVEITVSDTEVKPKDEYSYLAFYDEVRKIADSIGSTVVRIDKITTRIDWFGEKKTVHESCTGLVLAEDGVDIMVLCDYSSVRDGEDFEIEILGKTVPAELYAIDGDVGVAILSVAMSSFTKEEMAEVKFAVLAAENNLFAGMPIISLGKVNGYDNSLDIGIVTSLGGAVPVLDGQVKYFTTNWIENTEASGFVFDTSGYVVGMITHTYRRSSDSMVCCVTLDTIRLTIQRLMNHSRLATFGILGTDLPASVAIASEISDGIYVNEIVPGSTAYEIGLVSGDIITQINGFNVRGINDLYEVVLRAKAGDQIRVNYYHINADGKKEIDRSAVLRAKQ